MRVGAASKGRLARNNWREVPKDMPLMPDIRNANARLRNLRELLKKVNPIASAKNSQLNFNKYKLTF